MSCGPHQAHQSNFKLKRVWVAGDSDQPRRKPEKVKVDDLVGKPTEADVELNGVRCRALLDTGANVSTIAQSCYNNLFKSTPLLSLDDFKLDITVAGDHKLPYLGYIEAELSVPRIGINSVSTLILVVPDTKYSSRVPILIGTNILEILKQNVKKTHGLQYRQKIQLPDAWDLTFRCMAINSKAMDRANGRLAVIKCASQQRIVIPGNTTTTVAGWIDKPVLTSQTLGILEPMDGASLPEGVTVTPALVELGGMMPVPVQLSNLTARPVAISPLSILCQVQSCSVEEVEKTVKAVATEGPEVRSPPLLDQIDLAKSKLSTDEKSGLQKLITEFSDVFSHHDLDVGLTSAMKHRIILTNPEPFQQRHRRIHRQCSRKCAIISVN